MGREGGRSKYPEDLGRGEEQGKRKKNVMGKEVRREEKINWEGQEKRWKGIEREERG